MMSKCGPQLEGASHCLSLLRERSSAPIAGGAR